MDRPIPWLVYTHRHSNRTDTFCDIFSNERYIDIIPELRGKEIIACCHEWLILWGKNKTLSLMNLITKECILLPQLPINVCKTVLTCMVTSPPSNPKGCVVFLFFKERVLSCSPSMNASSCDWVSHRIDLDGNDVEIKLVAASVNNGVMYGIAGLTNPNDNNGDEEVEYNTVSMEIQDDNSIVLNSMQQLKRPICDHGCNRPYYYLVESCGLIYCVGVFIRYWCDTRIGEVKVWELETVGGKWVETKCLGGRSFFIGKDCCTWCWGATTSTRGNCVYFVSPIDELVYVYRLEDDTLTMLSSCPALTPYNLPIWVNVKPPQQHYYQSERVLEVNDIQGQELVNTIIPKQRTNLLIELPTDIIQLASSKYMHLFDYWNFRDSCKTLHSMLPKWRANTNSILPLFIWFKNSRGLCKLMDPSREESYSMILDLSHDPFIVNFSKDGWLILTIAKTQSIKFCNPLTRVMGDYPPNKEVSLYDVRSIGFSTCPTSPDCVTVKIVYDNYLHIYYLRYGDKRWTRYDIANINDFGVFGTSSPVYFNGAFYILDSKFGNLGEFELVDGVGSWHVYLRPYILCAHFHSTHLVECGGKLFAIYIGYMGSRIKVLEFNHVKKQWVDIQNIGNCCLFINHSSSISISTTEKGMRNKIFVPRIKENGILFYSLETGLYHVSGREDFMKNFCNTAEPLNTCWL